MSNLFVGSIYKNVVIMPRSSLTLPSLCRALAMRDAEFLDVLENVEALTDPENKNYFAALTGRDMNEVDDTDGDSPHIKKLKEFLDLMNGELVLYLVLLFVAFAILLLIVQLSTNSDEPALVVIDYIITIFFAIEVSSKLGAYCIVYGEIDTFLLDPLNFIDVAVGERRVGEDTVRCLMQRLTPKRACGGESLGAL